jgi:pilus assembly protein Flp/PilA
MIINMNPRPNTDTGQMLCGTVFTYGTRFKTVLSIGLGSRPHWSIGGVVHPHYLADNQCTAHITAKEEINMIGTQIMNFVMRAWRDRRGQDLVEYALMAGFVAVAAGAIMPGVSSSISTIFSQVGSVMTNAAS